MSSRSSRALLACLGAATLAALVVLAAHSVGWEGLALSVTAGLAAAAATIAGMLLVQGRGSSTLPTDADDLLRRLDLMAVRQVETRDELRADLAELREQLARPDAPGGR